MSTIIRHGQCIAIVSGKGGTGKTSFTAGVGMALAMQGMTSDDKEEMKAILDMLTNCDGGTGFMHEGFHVDDPTVFTRPWFTWPDSLFCEFVNKCMDEGIV